MTHDSEHDGGRDGDPAGGGRDEAAAEVLGLRCELGRARQTIRQREESLAALNRRLLSLEREQWRPGNIDPELAVVVSAGELDARRARQEELVAQLADAHQQLASAHQQLAVVHQQLAATTAELARLRATKLFRVAAPARRIYARLRQI